MDGFHKFLILQFSLRLNNRQQGNRVGQMLKGLRIVPNLLNQLGGIFTTNRIQFLV